MIVEEQGIGFRTGVRFPSGPLKKRKLFVMEFPFFTVFSVLAAGLYKAGGPQGAALPFSAVAQRLKIVGEKSYEKL